MQAHEDGVLLSLSAAVVAAEKYPAEDGQRRLVDGLCLRWVMPVRMSRPPRPSAPPAHVQRLAQRKQRHARAGRMDAPHASAGALDRLVQLPFRRWHKSLPRYGGIKREICSCPDSSSRVRSMTISLIWSTSSCGAMASSALPAASRTGRCSLTHRRLEKCSAVWNAASGWLRTGSGC